MNHYSELLYYIKSLVEQDSYINTITKGEVNLDVNKENIFPLFNIAILSGSFTNGQTINFNVELTCLDIRDINKEIINDKFWEQDNEVDNHNETLACLNRVWLKMYRDFEQRNITASENPSLEIGTLEGKNLLDGWVLTFDVEMPNTTISLCDGN
jgi:hypothetical protein